MKKNIGLIILIVLMCIIASFLACIVVSKQHLTKDSFNLHKNQELVFEKYDTKVKILNIASSLCKEKKCQNEGEIEVSVEVIYNDEKSNYTLKSRSDRQKRIKNSNNYILLTYQNDAINIDIKDRYELE